MNRRGFLSLLVGGVAAAAAERAFPFRVFSFPSQVVEPSFDAITAATLADLKADVPYFFLDTPLLKYLKRGAVLATADDIEAYA